MSTDLSQKVVVAQKNEASMFGVNGLETGQADPASVVTPLLHQLKEREGLAELTREVVV